MSSPEPLEDEDEEDELERLFQAGAGSQKIDGVAAGDKGAHRPGRFAGSTNASLGLLPDECIYNVLVRCILLSPVCGFALLDGKKLFASS